MDLGATPLQALRLATLPMLSQHLVGRDRSIFTLVFDDFVLAFFTTGVDPQPLSVRVYSSIRFGVSAVHQRVGTLMLIGSLLLIFTRPAYPAPVRPRGRSRPVHGGHDKTTRRDAPTRCRGPRGRLAA